jgi:hypothetical protein
MNNKNIFEKNVKIPDIVQQKANAAFATIYTRQDEPEEKPQKAYRLTRATIIKIASAVVVAAMTIAVLSVALAFFSGQESELPEGSTNGSTRVSVVGNEYRFAIKVCAAELEPKDSLPISLDVGNQAFGYGGDCTGGASFEINFPITVEGENISSVNFKVDNAVFEVVSIDCPSIVKSGSPKTLPDYRSTYVNGYDMAGHPIGKTEVGYYESFSADYDTLQNSKYLFNICNAITDRMDLFYLLIHDGNDDDRCAAYTYLVKDVKVTVEVTFNDGTTSSRTLGLFANQFLATDKMADGTEYTYNATQIFCYDENDIDDATKQLISSQIARAKEIIKAEKAAYTGSDVTTADETVDETDATTSSETTVSPETTVSTEAPETTPEVSSTESTPESSTTENTDNVSADDNAGTSEDT